MPRYTKPLPQVKRMTNAEMCEFHKGLKSPPCPRLNAIIDVLRTNYKNGRVEPNIYYDEKKERLRVKYLGKWLGYFFTIKGARDALAKAKAANPTEEKTPVVKREVHTSCTAVEKNIYYQMSCSRYRVKYKGKWQGSSKTVEGAREILEEAKLNYGKLLNKKIRSE